MNRFGQWAAAKGPVKIGSRVTNAIRIREERRCCRHFMALYQHYAAKDRGAGRKQETRDWLRAAAQHRHALAGLGSYIPG